MFDVAKEMAGHSRVETSAPADCAEDRHPFPIATRTLHALDACTIFLGSLLLFLVQPMMAKALLPWFGGSAGVWTSAMFFFQAVLLLGYYYAHFTTRRLASERQWKLHVVLLAASLALLPIAPSAAWKPESTEEPVARILLVLAASVGLPCLLLSATSPLVQVGFARRTQSPHPYRLFAVSNLASLAALLAYPVAIEPLVSTGRQLRAWSAAYAVFVLLAGAESFAGRAKSAAVGREGSVPTADRLLWLVLAACPSILWLGAADALSQDIAPIPLLWIVPFSIYLVTLILCFHRESWYRPREARIVFPAGWLVTVYCVGREASGMSFLWAALLFCAGLFTCCMFCHGELARRKPAPEHLTTFYLTMALGGAAGGLFVGVIAPAVFSSYTELPIAVVGCGILALALLYGVRRKAQLARLGVTAIAGLLLANWIEGGVMHTILRVRNFYGALQVAEEGTGASALRILNNGPIHHGAEYVLPEKRRLAITYYGPDSGVARAIRSLPQSPLRVGVIGLGVGTLAGYARPGDDYRFYEINPAVIRLAKMQFWYLSGSAGNIEVVPGDGRLSLEREPHRVFDFLVLDAFSGDSIPTHLLTREAFRVYYSHLAPDGVLAVNITNRYLDLSPVIERLAEDSGRPALLVSNAEEPSKNFYAAVWAVVTANPAVLRALRPAAVPFPAGRSTRLWTDDYTSLLPLLR